MTDSVRLNSLDPAFGADVERSKARIADVELGLTGRDSDIWHDLACRRIRALEECLADYGLMSHEYAELERLRQLVRTPPSPEDVLACWTAFTIWIAILLAISVWSPQ